MMKKLLIVLFALTGIAASAQFANIGIIGSATPTGWDSDTDMATTDGVVYTLNNFTLTAGQVKFRKDNLWTDNWGGTAFPSGTAIYNGGNLSVLAGIYNITFNLTTLQYSFVDVSGFPGISLAGTFNEWMDVPMSTTDGIHYDLPYQQLPVGDVKFKSTGSWSSDWGGTTFPQGTGVPAAQNIVVNTAKVYHVTFNLQTKDYNFDNVTVSILGTAVSGWETDVPMITTDGINYTLEHALAQGEIKFRAANSWDYNWGGVFPSGTAVDGGANIVVPIASTYSITFNNQTKAFSIVDLLAVEKNTLAGLIVYPNPSRSAWTINAGNAAIDAVELADIMGKKVYSVAVDGSSATIYAESLAPGVYFAKIVSGKDTAVIKLVRN